MDTFQVALFPNIPESYGHLVKLENGELGILRMRPEILFESESRSRADEEMRRISERFYEEKRDSFVLQLQKNGEYSGCSISH